MSKTYSTKTYATAFGVGALLMAFGLFAFTQLRSAPAEAPSIIAAADQAQVQRADTPVVIDGDRKMVVYKSATCGCCKGWISYLQKAGYEIEAVDEDDMMKIKAKYGIPGKVRSCHTGIIDGYVVEGHVPVEDIERMLSSKPQVAGIATPGMPVGSPGMEQGDQKDPYDVVAFQSTGETAVFASHNK